MGEPVLMDGANDIEDVGLSEDLWKEGTLQCYVLERHPQPDLPSPNPTQSSLGPQNSWMLMPFRCMAANGVSWAEIKVTFIHLPSPSLVHRLVPVP